MIKLLIRRFIADYQNVEDTKVREAYSVLGGVVGIICNAFLFIVKLTIGILIKSIAIISDAFNNLSDMGSSLVAIIGSKISNRHPDKEHPFGHGRIEYISSLIVSFLIMMVGLELVRSSFERLLNPEALEFNPVLILILCLSVLVKVWMFFYNRYIGTMIQSGVMKAVATDSLNDVFATTAVIISTVVGHFFSLPIDGAVGLVVSGLIIYTGFDIAKNTIDVLLGNPPSPELVSQIESAILEGEGIVGVHDLVVHDYGPGRIMASAHAEVPDTADVVKVHEVIDEIEQKIFKDMDIHIVLHTDPISVNCERTNSIKELVTDIVKKINDELSIHDFRLTDGENRINLIFDLVVPHSIKQEERDKVVELISKKLSEVDSRYHTVIQLDNSYLA